MKYIILALNLLALSASQKSYSQQDSFESLSIGDQMSDLPFKQIINYEKPSAKYSDFAGKAMIIDLWAPWCTPCVAAFPKLDSLQKKYSDKLQILPVTKENKDYANKLLTNLKKEKGIDLTMSVVEDKLITRVFQHAIIPHYIWITPTGVVKAITDSKEVTDENIRSLIMGEELNVVMKDDGKNELVKVDMNKPIFAKNLSIGKQELQYSSIITKFIQGIRVEAASEKNWIRITNQSIAVLFQLGFGKWDLSFLNNNRLVLVGFNSEEDSLLIGRYTPKTLQKWKEVRHNYFYNYELTFPDSMFTREQKFEMMQQDLNRYFTGIGITAKTEKKTVDALELVRTSNDDLLKSKGGNRKDQYSTHYLNIQNLPIDMFLVKFQAFFSTEGDMPMVDRTNYKGNVDIEINADLTNIDQVNNELKKYGLALKPTKAEMQMVIITKRNK